MIIEREEGILIVERDRQPAKELVPKDRREVGSEAVTKEEQ